MKIDIIVNDGSPLGVTSKTIYGDKWQVGVGGAELALLTMCEEWADQGYDVTLFNNPREPNDRFNQRNIEEFRPQDDRDILIVFRSPNGRIVGAKGMKVWWSCDQMTIGDFSHFSKQVDRIVVISEFHKRYFESTYHIHDTIVIDLPIRWNDYIDKIDKIPNRLIFTSIPDRGLIHLDSIWNTIKHDFPDATLVITADYRLWGVPSPQNEQYRLRFARKNGVEFLGAVPRERLCEEQLKADLFVYPCIYDELFCIACSEAQIAGAYPVTSNRGALETTNMGTIVEGNPSDVNWKNAFIGVIRNLLQNRRELKKQQFEIRQSAFDRFHAPNIVKQWDEKVFKYG